MSWVVEGATVASGAVEYGQTPAYGGDTPTKEATAEYSYEFTGWSPTVAAVTGEATYTAQFSAKKRSYTVSWVVEGATVASGAVEYGQTPSYGGDMPTKAETSEYTYTFNGWTPAIVAVTGPATYTATFTATPKEPEDPDDSYDGTETINGVTWSFTVEDGEATITYADSAEDDIVIPDTVTNGVPVTAIAPYAFSGSEATSVTIGRNIKKIGTVVGGLPEDWDLEENWMLETAFIDCHDLENFYVAEGNEVFEAIGGCLYYRNTPNNAKSLALYPCGRDSLYFASGITVTEIGDAACLSCSEFGGITIPATVGRIGIGSFCSTTITNLVVQNGTTNIDDCAFYQCPYLMDAEIAGTVKRIGKKVFVHSFFDSEPYDENAIARLVLHEGIEEIDDEAFQFCRRIGEIIIPDSVTRVGKYAFSESSAKRIVIGNGVETISPYAFAWNSAADITIGTNVTSIGNGAFCGSWYLAGLEIPEGVTNIGAIAFSNCENLRTVSLPDTLETIGAGAFWDCYGVRKLIVPLSVEEIGLSLYDDWEGSIPGAFAGMTGLERIYMPASLKPATEEATLTYIATLFEDLGLESMSAGERDAILTWYSNVSELAYATIRFNDGGTITTMQVLDYFDAPLPVPSKSGHVFAGWWTGANGTGTRLSKDDTVSGDATYYAYWRESPLVFGGDVPWYAVYDDSYGEDMWVLHSGEVGFGETSTATLNVTGPCIVSYSCCPVNGADDDDGVHVYVDGVEMDFFSHDDQSWSDRTYEIPQSGAHAVVFAYENVSGDVDGYALLANVTANAAEAHAITFDPRGGTMGEATYRLVVSSTGTLPKPRKNYAAFSGWFTAADGGTRITESHVVTQNLNLYAHWVDAPFTVGGDRIWLDGGDGSFVSESLEVGETIYAEKRVTGPCTVSFDLMVDTDYWTNNRFEVYVDGEEDAGFVNRSWTDWTVEIEEAGEHVIRWLFEREETGRYGYSNSVGLRNIEITGGGEPEGPGEPEEPEVNNVDLSTLSGAYTAQNGDILAGSTAYRVTVADGATITLAGVAISNTLACAGSAVIQIADGTVNVISQRAANDAGIRIGGTNTTLVINGGTGKLLVETTGRDSPAIGNVGYDGGDIIINGGDITAIGYGGYSPGIGGGSGTGSGERPWDSTCGDITINGGTIVATGGSQGAAIGGNGWYGLAGDITIGAGITRLVATMGNMYVPISGCPINTAEGKQVIISDSLRQTYSHGGKTLTLVPMSADEMTWMVVDLRTGAKCYYGYDFDTATNTFNTAEYKTVKMAFRRVPKGEYFVQNGTKTATMERDYYMALFATTEAQYQLMLNPAANVTTFSSTVAKGDVSWTSLRGTSEVTPQGSVSNDVESAAIYRLNELTGMRFDLPTIAMWEVASLAKPTNAVATASWSWFFGPTIDSLAEYAWNGDWGIHEVGLLKPNEWGLYDVYGNVWEWCADGWGYNTMNDFEMIANEWQWSQTPNGDGRAPDSRRCAGGSSWELSDYCNSVFINTAYKASEYEYIGFRLSLIVNDADDGDEPEDPNGFRILVDEYDPSYVIGFEGTCPATITAADWPEGVEYIDMDAFNGCTNLQHLTLPAGIRDISWHAFLNCEALETVDFSNCFGTLSGIGTDAFNGCTSLRSLVLDGDGLELSSGAFYACTSLASLELGSGVSQVNEFAFGACTSLATVTVDSFAGTDIDMSAFIGTAYYKSMPFSFIVKEDWDGKLAVAGFKGVCPANIAAGDWPSGVEAIYDRAFPFTAELRSVAFPASFARIAAGSFACCTNLESITFPTMNTSAEEYMEVGHNAFALCTKLRSITLRGPLDVSSEAFAGCSSLATVEFDSDVSFWGNGVFARTAISSVVIPEDMFNWSLDALAGNDGTVTVYVPRSDEESCGLDGTDIEYDYMPRVFGLETDARWAEYGFSERETTTHFVVQPYCRLTLDLAGGTGVATNMIGSGTTVGTQLPTPTRSGYTFAGWTSARVASIDAQTTWTAIIGSETGMDAALTATWTPDAEPPQPETPTIVFDDEKVEDPVLQEDGTRVFEAQDGVTLTQDDVEEVSFKSPIDTTVDITEAYDIKLDTANNQIVATLAMPRLEEVPQVDDDADDPAGMLDDVDDIDESKIAAMPEADASQGEEVGALPVKMYKGLYYRVSWGSDLNALTQGEKFRADGTQTHIGVIKQTGTCGFYSITVSEEE